MFVTVVTRKYKKIDLRPIKKCNSPEIAYILGFIAADGCISKRGKQERLSINLQRSDISFLKLIARVLNCDNPIKGGTARAAGITYKTCSLNIYQQGIVTAFKTWSIVPNKSLTLNFPLNLPKKYISHFIRGYFDGDGGVSFFYIKRKKWTSKEYNVTFCSGSILFLKELKKILTTNKIKCGKFYHSIGSTCNSFRIAADNNSLEQFYKYLYENSTIHLNRKYKKLQQILNYRSKSSKLKNNILTKKLLTKEFLYQEYIVKKKPYKQIMLETHRGSGTVLSYINKFKLQRKNFK